MRRTTSAMIGTAAGVVIAGPVTAVLVPVLPPAWRSEELVWLVAVIVIVASASVAAACGTPRRG